VDLNYYIDYKNADVDFLIEIYRDLQAFAICPGYKNNNKFNL
jgi:hypothetical protein